MKALSLMRHINGGGRGYPAFWRACIIPTENVPVWIRCKYPTGLGDPTTLWLDTEVEVMARMSGLRFLHVCYEGKDVTSLSPVELLALPYCNDIVGDWYNPLFQHRSI